MSKMLLSIIIPVFNVECFLHDCIDSILRQNCDDIEIILVDDGSTDSSGSICDYYASNYKNLYVYHKTNGGLSDSRNYGVSKAKGAFIGFVDSDDCIEKDSINYILELLKQKNPDILNMRHRPFIDVIPSIVNNDHSYIEYKKGLNYLNDSLKKDSYYACVPFSVYKSELVKSIPFEVGIVHEDELWTPKVYEIADCVLRSNYYYYFYRSRQNSITTNKDKTKGSRDLMLVCNDLYRHFRHKKISEKRGIINHICTLYLSSYVDWKMSEHTEMSLGYSRTFPLKCSYGMRNYIKSLVFLLSPALYYYVYKLTKLK